MLDTGSVITIADNSLNAAARQLVNEKKFYGGVSSSGVSELSGKLDNVFGDQILSVDAAFTDLPNNMDMIHWTGLLYGNDSLD